MKVVINKCYGGYSLSPLAVKRLAELRGKPCYFFKDKIENLGFSHEPVEVGDIDPKGWAMWSAFTVPNPDEVCGTAHWHSLSLDERKARNARYAEINLDSRPDKRDDPLLVQVVEELGKKANGSCAELKVVEIPDGAAWEIDEYDGIETLRAPSETYG